MQTTRNHVVFKPILEKDIINNHIEVETTYNNKNYKLNVSNIHGHFYIHVTPFIHRRKFESWKYSPNGINQISKIDTKVKPYNSIYMLKTNGSWIAKDLFIDYGNWLGNNLAKNENNLDLIGFGTHFVRNILNNYNKAVNCSNPYFLKIKNGVVRINRENNFIYISDIMKLANKTVKSFHKSARGSQYIKDQPDHYLSVRGSTSGSTSCHPKLTKIALDWCPSFDEKDKVYAFVDEALKRIEKEEEEDDEEEDGEEESKEDVEDGEEEEEEEEEVEDKEKVEEEEENESVPDMKTNLTIPLKDDYQFKLKLKNGSSMDILIRKDGYVNATQLCKAGNKLFKHYNENNQTKEYLQALSSVVGIPTTDLLDIKQGGTNQGTYVHRKVAYHLAQWISPHFAVQVSDILDELFLTGKVELGKEKSNEELEDIYSKKRLSLDYQENICKDVLYVFEFQPEICEVSIEDENDIHYFEFGVTSDIKQRSNAYGTGYRLDRVFEYSNGSKTSLAEKYVKNITRDLGMTFEYKKKTECIKCKYEGLEKLYALIEEHNRKSNEMDDDKAFIIEKMRLELCIETAKTVSKKTDMLLSLLEKGRITFDQCKELMTV